MTQGLHVMSTFQSEVCTHANRSDWPTELKGIFKCNPSELHPSRAPATVDRWLEGLGGLWDGVREREWELQGVVTEVKLLKWVKGGYMGQFQLAIPLNVTVVVPVEESWLQERLNFTEWKMEDKRYLVNFIHKKLLFALISCKIQYNVCLYNIRLWGKPFQKNCKALIVLILQPFTVEVYTLKWLNAIAYVK